MSNLPDEFDPAQVNVPNKHSRAEVEDRFPRLDLELSPILGDGLMDQAAAVWA